MREVVIVGAARTAIGSYGGALKGVTARTLGATAIKAALERAERAARRERLGIADNEIPASQVGNRRYARGRAYVPDRYTNPENAEAATLAAAEASEGAASIDESIEEEVLTAASETVSAAEDTSAIETETKETDDYLGVELSVDLGNNDEDELPAEDDSVSEDTDDVTLEEEN